MFSFIYSLIGFGLGIWTYYLWNKGKISTMLICGAIGFVLFTMIWQLHKLEKLIKKIITK